MKSYEARKKFKHLQTVFSRLRSRKDAAKKMDLFMERIEKYQFSVKRQL